MNDILKPNKNAKLPAGAPPAIVIQKIDVRPFNRTTQDIPGWRRAIQNAESTIPRRYLLYNLYADVVQDAHVIAVTGKRLDAVTNANWQFVNKEGKPIDAINELIDSSGFDDIVTEILNSKFWGYSIMEPTFYKDTNDTWEVEANLVPRLNYRPESGVVAFDYTGDDGINIREGVYAKTIMEVGKTNDLGLLLSAAQYAILKRGGIGDYAMFVQVFGRPIIDATWDGFDETQRIKLLESLNIGPGGVIVRPDGTTVTILESKLTTSTIHKDFKDDMNAEISKALLGTTETTESSSSSGYAQSKTHSDQDNNKHESDINFVRKVLNSRFVKVLEAHGLLTESGSFIIQGEETKQTTSESFEMHKTMATELALPIDDDFWYETYGVPKPDNYQQIKNERKLASENTEVTPKSDPKAPDKKTQKTPDKKDPTNKKEDVKKAEVNLMVKGFKDFIKLFQAAPTATIGATCGSHHINLTFDGPAFDDVALLERVWEKKGTIAFDFDLFDYTVSALLKGFKKGWDDNFIKLDYAPGFTYNAPDPALLTAFEQNIFRFSGAKTLAEAQILNELFRKSTSFNEFMELAKARVEIFNKEWLLTEFNTAVLTGEAASTYHRLMAQIDIFPYWKYTTVGDEHVRDTHRLLNNVIMAANDPRWAMLFPPNGWNCRCYIVPRMKHEVNEAALKIDSIKVNAYLGSVSFAKEKAQGWGVNRGEIGEIFTANQQYIHKFPGQSSKLLNNLKASDFNLLQYSNAKKAATSELPVYTGKPESFYKDLEVFNETPVIRDYVKRPLAVSEPTFMKQPIAKLADQTLLIAAMQQALLSPNEVWLSGELLEELIYLKYYMGKTMVVRASAKNMQVNLIDWFLLVERKTDIDLYRKGLLVFGKK